MSIIGNVGLHELTAEDVSLEVLSDNTTVTRLGVVTVFVGGDSTRERLTNLRLIAARIDELALAEITKINRAEYTALPLEDVDEGEFLDAWGITPGDLGDIVSLERTDPGDEPIVIDVDGTEVAA